MRSNLIRRMTVVGAGTVGTAVVVVAIILLVLREGSGPGSSTPDDIRVQQADTERLVEATESGDPDSLPPADPEDTDTRSFLSPVTDAPSRRSLQLRRDREASEEQEAVPALITLEATLAGRSIEPITGIERQILEAFLRLKRSSDAVESDSGDVADLKDFILPRARGYLIDEFRSELDATGSVTATYRVDSGLPETIQFVLFFREYALVVNLYLEEEMIADGEVIRREWSRRRTLAYP